MFPLPIEDKTCITLGKLRQFINNECLSLSDDTLVKLSTITESCEPNPCVSITVDSDCITLYDY